jgi:hypothetical protein
MDTLNAKSKRDWTAPELTVLVRSKPEEAVLGVCKVGLISSGSQNWNNACFLEMLNHGCGECSSIGGS